MNLQHRRDAAALGVMVLAVVVSAVALPAVVSGEPANQVDVAHLPGEGGALATPTSDLWTDVEATVVPLSSAPSGLPNAKNTATDAVTVRAATTEERLYVRMHWSDATNNSSTNAPTAFADAVAMQVPVDPSTHPPIALGSVNTPVNVWYWNAAEGPEQILAGGQGSITHMDTNIRVAAVHREGAWTVVMHRSLVSDARNHTTFTLERDVDVAFAVWNGANGERSGHHAVSTWFTYPFGPQPTGPWYQYLLWAVAGVAIVVAVLVTATAIRRTNQ
ncbi:MAG: ethylbenzene dehydrogenase-related protein [Halanaeroarchaeum sp.]